MKIMQELGVDPTPRNYEVFFAYCESANQGLNRAITPYVEGKKAWSNAKGDAIYNLHIADNRLAEFLDATSAEVGNELQSVMQILSEAGKDAAKYEKTLVGAEGNLKNTSDPRSIREVVDHLVQATTNMQHRSQKLEQKLAKTNQQVETLQNNLDRVKIEAMTDSLSGLCNRKRFDEVLAEERERALINNKPLALVLCDIDHFKRFNDTWGHQTGDQIIRFVSGTLKKNVDKDHVSARYGGEEFALIMPNTKLEAAIDIAENIRGVIERKKLMRKSTNENLGKITISMGISMFRHTDEVEDIIERADKALYSSKQSGRNRVSTDQGINSEVAA